MNDKDKQKIKDYIEYIEQLAADARFDFNLDKYYTLRTKINGIEFWANKIDNILDKYEEKQL